jgi:hypothetical protein
VLVDDVIGESNLLQSLRTSDDDLSRTENTACDFFHVMGWFELDLDGRISVWFERNFENIVVFFEPICHFHEVDVVVETEVGINHDHPKRVFGEIDFQIQKGLENVNQLSDDAFAIEEVAAPCDLNASIGEHLDRFGAVCIVIGECHLIIKCRGLQFPLKTF